MIVIDQIQPIFENKCFFEGELTENLSIREDLGLDSLDLIEVIASLEDLFHIEIPDEELVDLETLGDILTYIEAHKC